MKNSIFFILMLSSLLSTGVQAALVSVGPFVLDDDAFASSAVLSPDVEESTAGAITDNLLTSYINGNSASSSATLSFDGVNVVNGTGADLALFFLTEINTISMSVAGTDAPAMSYTSSQLFYNPDDPFVDIGDGAYGVTIGTDVFALSAILVDLDDFGMAANAVMGDITIGLGNREAFLALASGVNITPVPLPAPFFLLLSGLTALGLIGRRKS